VKAVLEFDLPEDAAEFRQAADAGRYLSVITDHLEWLRTEVKYTTHPDAVVVELERVRKNIFDLIEEHGVTAITD